MTSCDVHGGQHHAVSVTTAAADNNYNAGQTKPRARASENRGHSLSGRVHDDGIDKGRCRTD